VQKTYNSPETVAAQAEQAFQNIAAVLKANGPSMDDVVQTTTYLLWMIESRL